MKNAAFVCARLSAFPSAAKAILQKQAEYAALEALKEARRAVPVLTGRLRRSLQADFSEGKARVLSRCPYAGFVELGTRFQRSQPYLRPAARLSSYGERAREALQEVFR